MDYDGDVIRNAGIISERLTPEEIVMLENSDDERSSTLEKGCDKLISKTSGSSEDDRLFTCGVGAGSFTIGYDGLFRACSTLMVPETQYDLRKGTLAEAWEKKIPFIRKIRSNNPDILQRCRNCQIVDLCYMCPARAYLENGNMDSYIEYFCKVAHTRAKNLGYNPTEEISNLGVNRRVS